MAYTNSSMVVYKNLSPNHSGQRTHSIDRITPHCIVGQCTAEGLGDWFTKSSTQASSNYGIDKNGRVGLYVEEKNRSWCSSSNANDQRAVTIECASDTTEPYAFKDVVYQTLIKLCIDICKRNGKNKLIWFGDKNKTLNYEAKSGEMILTVHRWFANKSCPGNWLYSRMGDLAEKVTAALGGSASSQETKATFYRVRKTWADAKTQKGAYKVIANAKKCADANPGYSVFDENGVSVYPSSTAASDSVAVPFLVKVSISDLNIRKGPGTDYDRTKFIPVGIYTIMEVKSGQGSSAGWGRLKSGAGWVSLDYVKRI